MSAPHLLTPSLKDALIAYRAERAFDPALYLRIKLGLVARYFKETNLKAAVIGVSGGIDSALTLALLNELQKQERSCLKKTVPVCLPLYNSDGVTGQIEATYNAKKIINHLELNETVLDLGPIQQALYEKILSAFRFNNTAWSQGQLASNLRTPVLYQIANQLTESGYPCAVIGTINRDEGSFIGFFGKASDAMTDLQLISDLHKSEVKKLANFLGLPKEIINAIPTGNTYDGATDESAFAFSYDFLELYSYYLNLPHCEKEHFRDQLDKEGLLVFEKYQQHLLHRHQRNQHKYFTVPQGLHFDVYPKSVTGGWRSEAEEKKSLYLSRFHNLFVLDEQIFNKYWTTSPVHSKAQPILPYVLSIDNALTQNEVHGLVTIFEQQKKTYAGKDGHAAVYGKQLRATTYNPFLAMLLFKRLHRFLENYIEDDGYQPIDGGKNTYWRLRGFSPVFRFIAYEPEGELIGHYDEGYVDAREKTLFSVIIYLSDQEKNSGGETVILLDKDRNKPLAERQFSDDPDPINPNQILHAHCPQAGQALIIAHRIKHGVLKNKSNKRRIILRTDVVYESLGPVYPDTPPDTDALKTSQQEIQDVFYRSYYLHTLSLQKVVEAGFITSTPKIPCSNMLLKSWSIIPLMKLYNELKKTSPTEKELVVLLSTGGFYPIHTEHFSMMNQAKNCLEKQGKRVIAGFFSPSHQEYIKSKAYMDHYDSTEHINQLIKSVAKNNWLDIWLWEYLENSKPINFTEVILKLESELGALVKTTCPIKVAYVFGGDNAAFAYAFIDRGIAVCLSRPGSERQLMRVKEDPLLLGKNTINFLDNDNPLSLASATIRQQCEFKQQKGCQEFYLRDDEDLSCQLWQKQLPLLDFNAAKINFLKQLTTLFVSTYTRHNKEFSLKVVSAKQQIAAIKNQLHDRAILSLDPCYNAEFNLSVSRYFRFGLPEISLGIFERPEAETLEKQLNKLPKQPYFLIDDDTYSGETINYVKKLLEQEHTIEGHYVSVACDNPQKNTEISDLRDFIVGAYYGGLVVMLPNNTIARVPYLYPYVLPSQRYHCPPSENINFSLAVWKLNQDFFSGEQQKILISHCDNPFINLAEYLGFPMHMPLFEFCKFHVQQLNQLCQNKELTLMTA